MRNWRGFVMRAWDTFPRPIRRQAEQERTSLASSDSARFRKLDGDFRAAFTPAVCSALLSEIAALRGERDTWKAMAENGAGSIIAHINRAAQAERQRDEAVGLLEDLSSWFTTRPQLPTAWIIPCGDMGADDAVVAVRAFIANQGADQ